MTRFWTTCFKCNALIPVAPRHFAAGVAHVTSQLEPCRDGTLYTTTDEERTSNLDNLDLPS